jgi:predicted ferric reductase
MTILRRYWLLLPYLAIVSFPSVYTLVATSEGWFDWRYNTAQLAGFTGATLLLLQLVLAARWQRLDHMLGFDQLTRVHKWAGIIGYCCIGLHALGISWYYLDFGWNSVLAFITPGWRWETLGMIAFDIMTVVIVITLLYRRWHIPYHWWKRIHILMYLSVFAGLIHSVYLGSHLVAGVLRWYWLGLMTLGLIALLYRRVIVPLLAQTYTVTGHDMIANGVHHFTFSPTNGPKFNYAAGQFAFVQFHANGISKEWHPFTISSAEYSDQLTMSIKESGDWTSRLAAVTVGTKAKIEGPYGQFSYRRLPIDQLNYVFMAGGIGITPLHAMITELLHAGSKRQILLLYAARSEQDFAFKFEFDQLAASHSNFKVQYITDRMNQSFLSNALPQAERNHYFICGPKPMMRSMRQMLRQLGVPTTQVHFEEFALN